MHLRFLIPLAVALVLVLAGVFYYLKSSQSFNTMTTMKPVDISAYTTNLDPVSFSNSQTASILAYCKNGAHDWIPPASADRMFEQQRMEELSLEKLFNKFERKEVHGVNLGDLFSSFADKLLQAGAVDDALAIWQCDAVHYKNIFATYRMARLYQDGTDALKEVLPEATITLDVQPDPVKSYFWINVVIYLESQEKMGFLDASTQFGWNTIATLDDLQNTGKLTQEERIRTEEDAMAFVAQAYPAVLESGISVENHSMQAVKDALGVDAAPGTNDVVQKLCAAGAKAVVEYSDIKGTVGGYFATSADGMSALYDGQGNRLAGTGGSASQTDALQFAQAFPKMQKSYPNTRTISCLAPKQTVAPSVTTGTAAKVPSKSTATIYNTYVSSGDTPDSGYDQFSSQEIVDLLRESFAEDGHR